MDGKQLAARVRADVAREIEELGLPVGLATVLVGEDEASAIYVRGKQNACREGGVESIDYRLSPETSEERRVVLVMDLNPDVRVTGIRVQLPRPASIKEGRVTRNMLAVSDG